ncbi:putative transporter YeaB [Marinithermofilum abyssi]|uniref:Putative transporter YeaB n=1 Tax=Marinithermofilum abyssi TaxID=1571185 RepID=A0A8J2VBN9_9BACL|nr:cation diffusion facilitator family transporter [Marinithermofilum abyssi]GGE08663.1 putative transporter YeaB [Marinithermofilum abyssi]
MKHTCQAETGVWASIGAYLFLVLIKLGAGYAAHSESVTADGWNNFTDILASVGLLIGIKIAQKPRDPDHPYGHSRAETVSSLLASFIMASIGLQVLFQAGDSALNGRGEAPDWTAAVVGMGGAAVMTGVYLFNSRLAEKTRSQALHAAARDNLSDALVSLGTAVAVLGSHWKLPWLDPAAALIVGSMILKTAWDIFRDTAHRLTDGFHPDRLKEYETTIHQIPGVKKVIDLKGRYQGNEVVLDVTIEVNADLSVKDSHDITDAIEQKMCSQYRVYNTHIHVEPDA